MNDDAAENKHLPIWHRHPSVHLVGLLPGDTDEEQIEALVKKLRVVYTAEDRIVTEQQGGK